MEGASTPRLDADGLPNYVAGDFEADEQRSFIRARRLRWPTIAGQTKPEEPGLVMRVSRKFVTMTLSAAGASLPKLLRQGGEVKARGNRRQSRAVMPATVKL